MKQIFEIIKWIAKSPNYIWNLPILNKIKGIRLSLLVALGALTKFLGTIDVDVLGNLTCTIASLLNRPCDSEGIATMITTVYAWLMAALMLEDNEINKAKLK